jgi:RNA polymerase sigma-70 factor (ECF subfamily)
LGAIGTMTVERAAVLLPGTGAPPACRRVSPLRSEGPETAGAASAPRVGSTAGAEAYDYVASAAAGDVSAFEHLYKTHLPRVHSLVRRMSGGRDADELTQDVFVRVWQKLGSFRGDSAFSTWLHRLAVNVVIERFRQDATRRQRLHDGERIFETLSAPVRSRDFSMDFEAALLSLPDGAREIFVLHDVEGYKHREIGTLLGISSGTSKAQLHRARMMLRTYLRSER